MKNKAIITITLMSLFFSNISLAEKPMLITINQFINHVSLDAVRDGIEQVLYHRHIVPDIAKINVNNAQGSISTSVQISQNHASLSPKFMIGISTPSAQTNMSALKGDTILAFAAVTDPEAANLKGNPRVIGVKDYPPITELIDITTQIFPNLKKIGVIFNSGEINSVKIIKDLSKILDNHNIALKKVSITSSNEIKIAINQLIGEVDIIYLPQDNIVVSAIDNIVTISNTHNIPLIANDPNLVGQGVLLALGTNYFKSGQQLGNMIADLIENKDIKESIQDGSVQELKINKNLVKKFNVKIPQNLIENED